MQEQEKEGDVSVDLVQDLVLAVGATPDKVLTP
jgi:hypothetical protein